jgi:hypothetical protein
LLEQKQTVRLSRLKVSQYYIGCVLDLVSGLLDTHLVLDGAIRCSDFGRRSRVETRKSFSECCFVLWMRFSTRKGVRSICLTLAEFQLAPIITRAQERRASERYSTLASGALGVWLQISDLKQLAIVGKCWCQLPDFVEFCSCLYLQQKAFLYGAIVLKDFDGAANGENYLPLIRGSALCVLQEDSTGWRLAVFPGTCSCGWVPRDYLDPENETLWSVIWRIWPLVVTGVAPSPRSTVQTTAVSTCVY